MGTIASRGGEEARIEDSTLPAVFHEHSKLESRSYTETVAKDTLSQELSPAGEDSQLQDVPHSKCYPPLRWPSSANVSDLCSPSLELSRVCSCRALPSLPAHPGNEQLLLICEGSVFFTATYTDFLQSAFTSSAPAQGLLDQVTTKFAWHCVRVRKFADKARCRGDVCFKGPEHELLTALQVRKL